MGTDVIPELALGVLLPVTGAEQLELSCVCVREVPLEIHVSGRIGGPRLTVIQLNYLLQETGATGVPTDVYWETGSVGAGLRPVLRGGTGAGPGLAFELGLDVGVGQVHVLGWDAALAQPEFRSPRRIVTPGVWTGVELEYWWGHWGATVGAAMRSQVRVDRDEGRIQVQPTLTLGVRRRAGP